ncbi:hypothetical protein [Terrarubrum flagellatum]|uniref:hypothetical protein n=1 Tax=Terrirubrum flagellatum TaxID=2895980 RepID=UPI0031456F9E
MSDMLRAAQAEVRKLEAELEASPVYKKLVLARQVVELYSSTPDKNESLDSAVGRLIEQGKQAAEVGTKTARIEQTAIEFLMKKRARATSGELMKAMEDAGIEIPGKEPSKSLSAYLSNSRLLNNRREAGGYGLAEWGTAAGPPQGANTGLFS